MKDLLNQFPCSLQFILWQGREEGIYSFSAISLFGIRGEEGSKISSILLFGILKLLYVVLLTAFRLLRCIFDIFLFLYAYKCFLAEEDVVCYFYEFNPTHIPARNDFGL